MRFLCRKKLRPQRQYTVGMLLRTGACVEKSKPIRYNVSVLKEIQKDIQVISCGMTGSIWPVVFCRRSASERLLITSGPFACQHCASVRTKGITAGKGVKKWRPGYCLRRSAVITRAVSLLSETEGAVHTKICERGFRDLPDAGYGRKQRRPCCYQNEVNIQEFLLKSKEEREY